MKDDLTVCFHNKRLTLILLANSKLRSTQIFNVTLHHFQYWREVQFCLLKIYTVLSDLEALT
jgi:hypothetical protein